MILVVLAISTAIYAGLAWLLLLLSRRYLGQQVAWIVGLLLTGYIVYTIADTAIACNAPPEFIPSDCTDPSVCGDGTMIFACDGPGGALDYGFIYLSGPLTACLILFLTFWVAKRPSVKKLES